MEKALEEIFAELKDINKRLTVLETYVQRRQKPIDIESLDLIKDTDKWTKDLLDEIKADSAQFMDSLGSRNSFQRAMYDSQKAIPYKSK